MKKKKLTVKLSLEKSKISALNASKIRGGATELQICGSITYCDPTWTLSEGTGSECKCL